MKEVIKPAKPFPETELNALIMELFLGSKKSFNDFVSLNVISVSASILNLFKVASKEPFISSCVITNFGFIFSFVI